MTKFIQYENDYFFIETEDFEHFELCSVKFKKRDATSEDWEGLVDGFTNYYKNLTKKYVMIGDISNLDIAPISRIKRLSDVLNEQVEQIDKYCIETNIVVVSSVARAMMKIIFTIYKNKKPVHIVDTYENAYDKIVKIVNNE